MNNVRKEAIERSNAWWYSVGLDVLTKITFALWASVELIKHEP